MHPRGKRDSKDRDHWIVGLELSAVSQFAYGVFSLPGHCVFGRLGGPCRRARGACQRERKERGQDKGKRS